MLTKRGEGFHLILTSEFQRFSLNARVCIRPECTLDLPEGSRPAPPVEEPRPTNEADEHAGAPAPADASAMSDESMHNISSLSQDVTMDSIRDYTQSQA